MSVRGFRFSILLSCAMVVIFAATSLAGAPGGSGRKETPYGNASPTVDAVSQMRNKICKERYIDDLKLIGDNQYVSLWHFALAYYNGDKLDGELKYSLDGHTIDGKALSLKLSDVEDFTRVEDAKAKKDGFAVFEVTVFPDLSPQQLLSSQMGYAELRREHEKKIIIQIPLKSINKGQLFFVDFINNVAKPTAKVADLVSGYKNILSASGRTAWWAIPSVVADDSYPFRVITKK